MISTRMTAQTFQHATQSTRDQRGVVLVLTLLVVTIAALVGSTVLVASRAELGTTTRAVERTRSRALAWSGVQAAMAELAQQREELLDGYAPILTQEFTVFELADGVRGVFRLVPIGPDSELATSENAKLDINTATEQALAQLPGIGEAIAKEIIQRRASTPFSSPAELMTLPSISSDKFTGVVGDEFGGDGMDTLGADRDIFEGASPSGEMSLSELVTVFSFDPNVQVGIGRKSADTRGDRRLNLNSEWTEELGREAQKRFGSGGADAIKGLMQSERELPTMGSVAQLLLDLGTMGEGLSAEDWKGAFDAVTTTDDWFLPGRVDINHAPAVVLATLPGLDADSAAEIVSQRERIDEETLQSPYWLIERSIIDQAQLVELIDHITTRSMQWRVRIEAGLLTTDPAGEEPIDEFGQLLNDARTLTQMVVYEAVIDVASQQPRVAYLRDVTQLPLAMTWAQLGHASGRESGFDRGADRDRDLDVDAGNLAEMDDAETADFQPEDATITNPGADRNASRSTDQTNTDRSGSTRSNPDLAPAFSDSQIDGANMEAGIPSGGSSSTSGDGDGSGGGDNRIGRWTTNAPKAAGSGGTS